MLEGIGFYCGMSMRWFRDAFCAAEVAAARSAAWTRTWSWRRRPPGAGRVGGVIAILSNVMNARRWAHASPSFLQFDLGDPAASGRGACVRAIEEAAAYVARGHRDIITELTGLHFSELMFTGGAAKGRCGRRSSPTCSACPCTSRRSPRAARSAPRSAPGSARASTPACPSCGRRCGAGRPPSSPDPAAVAALRRAVRDLARGLPADARHVRRRPAQPAVAGGRCLAKAATST